MEWENRENNLNAELEMIRDLRKRIYGVEEPKNEDLFTAEQQCVFCGSKSELDEYKSLYICQECVLNLKE